MRDMQLYGVYGKRESCNDDRGPAGFVLDKTNDNFLAVIWLYPAYDLSQVL